MLKPNDHVVLAADPNSRGIIQAVIQTIFGTQYRVLWTHGICVGVETTLDHWKVGQWTNPPEKDSK